MSTTGKGSGKDTPTAHAATEISSPDVSRPIQVEGPPTIDDHVGQVIADRYQLLSVLGRGGMGTVYLAEHIQLKKKVAVKLLADELHKQPTLVQRFLKEARAAAQIGHPNIVDVSDLGELPSGGAFIAMALLEGEDLQTELVRRGPLPVARARQLVGQICRALAAAHSKGIIHRDMKPANVFVALDGDGRETVKVLDFGIAQVQEPNGEEARLTQTGAVVGTPAFMSPEQGRGDRADHRADIYSVGCILYNLITGEVPFESNSLMGVITKHLLDAPVPPSQRRPELGLTPVIDAIVLRAMEKDPAARFQTMKEFFSALEGTSTDTPMDWPDPTSGRYSKLTPAPAGRGAASMPPKKSRAGLWVVLGLLGLAGGGGAFWYARYRLTPGSSVPTPGTSAPTTSTTNTPTTNTPTTNTPTTNTPTTHTPTTTGDKVVAPPPVALPAEVTIEIRSTPAGATVWLGDKSLGQSPLKLTRPKSKEELALHLSSEGHADESVVVTLDRDRLVDVRLEAKAAPTAKSPHPPGTKSGTPTVKKAGRSGDLKDPFSK